MSRTLVKGEPIRTCVAILALEPTEVDRSAIDPRRSSGLEALNGNPKLLKNLCKFHRRVVACTARRDPGLQPHMDHAAQERAGREHYGPG